MSRLFPSSLPAGRLRRHGRHVIRLERGGLLLVICACLGVGCLWIGAPFQSGWFSPASAAEVASAEQAGAPAKEQTSEPGGESFKLLHNEYDTTIRPLLTRLCLDCHSTERNEGELDLERLQGVESLRRHASVLAGVALQLEQREMPPMKSLQPTDSERALLIEWSRRFVEAEIRSNAGDPGAVVLRRLTNAQYTYVIQDLTGVPLTPVREFPADSAAGEGFTNSGAAQAMSPALVAKYLEAGKRIADHAVLVPQGFRFSPHIDRGDWINDLLAEIRQIYARYGEAVGGSQVNLQGIQFETNDGGRLPVERYVAATLRYREALLAGQTSLQAVALEAGLNEKYLGLLWSALTAPETGPVLGEVRERWQAAAPTESAAVTAHIQRWQTALWKFSSVGHIGKVGGPQAWQEPVEPLGVERLIRLPLTPVPGESAVVAHLVAGDAGDGDAQDHVLWVQPRVVAQGRPEIPIRVLPRFVEQLQQLRQQRIEQGAAALAVVQELVATSLNRVPPQESAQPQESAEDVALRHGVALSAVQPWLDYFGVGSGTEPALDLFTQPQLNLSGYEFVTGWGLPETPNLIANASDMQVRVPGNLPGHHVAMHPAPDRLVAVGWCAPHDAVVSVTGEVLHAHPECGDGVGWSLELRRGTNRQRLAEGIAHGGTPVVIPPIARLVLREKDLLSLIVSPRDGNHACDLTDVELVLESLDEPSVRWSLRDDVSPNVLSGNPHADRLGNPGVWQFYAEPRQQAQPLLIMPAGSLADRFRSTTDIAEQGLLIEQMVQLLQRGPSADWPAEHPDALLYTQWTSLTGPLLLPAWSDVLAELSGASVPVKGAEWVQGDLVVQAPSDLVIEVPTELAKGAELVATGRLSPQAGPEASVQLMATTAVPNSPEGLWFPGAIESSTPAVWTETPRVNTPTAPILVQPASEAATRWTAAFAEFRRLFPQALSYSKIVPVDEVVTLTLYHREDGPLRELMLSAAEEAQLNELWEQLHFVSQDAITLVDAFEQLMEYASQDGDPSVFAPLREPIAARAARFRESLVAAEPAQLMALEQFAARAYRRPLLEEETVQLRALYDTLRAQGLFHEEAFRLLLARVFVSPAFLYRLESAPAGTAPGSVSLSELASRLSFFVWASGPDEALMEHVSDGTLGEPAVLVSELHRLLKDDRAKRLGAEFGCQWLHVYEFDQLDEKSERHFPEFAALRGPMYEEAVRVIAEVLREDRSLLTLLNSNSTWVNEPLARFYGIDGVTGAEYRRVEGVESAGRGGILGLSATLAKQSGASRTSPILRGNWVSEVVLGEKLPRPPRDVPLLPEEEATSQLSVRELTVKHTSDPRCAGCHARIDPFGFALEEYDAIGRLRSQDSAGRPLDVAAVTPDGVAIEGAAGLRHYLLNDRRDDFVRQFCRKLLGYALGRSVQLSDEPLLAELQQRLKQQGYRSSVVLETIVLSPQFRHVRGQGASVPDQTNAAAE